MCKYNELSCIHVMWLVGRDSYQVPAPRACSHRRSRTSGDLRTLQQNSRRNRRASVSRFHQPSLRMQSLLRATQSNHVASAGGCKPTNPNDSATDGTPSIAGGYSAQASECGTSPYGSESSMGGTEIDWLDTQAGLPADWAPYSTPCGNQAGCNSQIAQPQMRLGLPPAASARTSPLSDGKGAPSPLGYSARADKSSLYATGDQLISTCMFSTMGHMENEEAQERQTPEVRMHAAYNLQFLLCSIRCSIVIVPICSICFVAFALLHG